MIFSENRYPLFGIMLATAALPTRPELPIIRRNGLGCRVGSAAEIKPIEPVWVMPA